MGLPCRRYDGQHATGSARSRAHASWDSLADGTTASTLRARATASTWASWDSLADGTTASTPPTPASEASSPCWDSLADGTTASTPEREVRAALASLLGLPGRRYDGQHRCQRWIGRRRPEVGTPWPTVRRPAPASGRTPVAEDLSWDSLADGTTASTDAGASTAAEAARLGLPGRRYDGQHASTVRRWRAKLSCWDSLADGTTASTA